MRLLSVNMARSIWFIVLTDLNPSGFSVATIVDDLVSRYRFAIYPQSQEDIDPQKGIVFKDGVFQKKGSPSVGINLAIYSDGFIADTKSSTSDSNAFLKDVLTWLSKRYGLAPHEEVLREKTYVSELYVKMEYSLQKLAPELEVLAKLLSSKIKGYGKDVYLETAGISFLRDSGTIGRPGPFKLERQDGIPFREHRYYSLAPLETEAHLEVLEAFENILVDKS